MTNDTENSQKNPLLQKGREVEGKRSASTKHRNNACKSGFSCNFDNFQFFSSKVLSKFEIQALLST